MIVPPRRMHLALLAGLSLAVLAFVSTAVVLPRDDRSIVIVSRFGDEVRLLPAAPAFSSPLLARRILLPRRSGETLVEATVSFPPIRVIARVAGSGVLPIPAVLVRDRGWNEGASRWIRRLMPTLDQGVRATPDWQRIFPGGVRHGVAGPAEAEDEKGGVRISGLDLAPGSKRVLLAAARSELASRTRAGGRLVVVGLDALDWRIVDELGRRGVMPHLQRLARGGAQGVLDVAPPLISPVVWTTIATGREPQEHGVLDFLEADPRDGTPVPVGSASRRVPAIWEMAAAAGRRCAVIGWWATYPAEASSGCVVYSDRLTEQLLGLEQQAPGSVAPAAAAAAAETMRVRAADLTAPMFEPYLRIAPEELAAIRGGRTSWEQPLGALARLLAATTTVERITRHELARGTDVVLVYLEGTDTVGHLFGAFRSPALPRASPADAARFGGVVDRYYARVDAWIGSVVASLGENDTLVIVSDHGFTWGDDRPPAASGAHTPTAVWWHRPEGVFIARGPRVRRTASRHRLDVLDVAPSLLALAGLPPAARMKGALPGWLFAAERRRQEAVDYAELLPRGGATRAALPDAAKEEALAKLRALGYIAGPSPRGAASAAAGSRTESRRLNNLGSAHIAAGRLDEAESALRRSIAADPTYAAAHHNLSLLHRKRGLHADADREFWKAVEHGIADREMSVVRLALDYRERRDYASADAVLAEGRRRFPGSAAIWLNSGVFLGERGEYASARDCLRRAIEIAPGSAAAHRNLATALEALGDGRGARRAMTRAVALDPANQAARRELDRLGGPLPD